MKKIISMILIMCCILMITPISSYAYEEYTMSTVRTATNFRKNPFITSVRLGIIYPGEIIYDCGIDENVLNNDPDYELVHRPTTNQMGYCEYHLILHLE